MLIHKGHRQALVSNRLALLAGVVMAVSAVAGLPGSGIVPGPTEAIGDNAAPVVRQQAVEVGDEDANTPQRKLNIRFLLFRHG